MSVACTRCGREFANERARKAHSVWCGGPQNARPTPPTDGDLAADLGPVLGPEWNDDDPPSPQEPTSTGAQALREQIEIEQARFQLRRIQIANKRLEDADRGPTPTPQPFDALAAALSRQGDQIAQLLAALTQRVQPPVPAPDAMGQFASFLQQMKLFKEIESPAGGGLAGLRDMVEIVKGMLPAPAPAGGGNLKELREIVLFGKELAGAAGDGEESVASVLKTGLDVLGKPLAEAWLESQQAKAIPSSPVYPHPAQLPRAQDIPPAETPTATLEEPMDDTMRVRWFVATLLAAAARKEPPELWVDQVIYHVPEEAMGELLAGDPVPDPIPLLAKIDKRVTLQAEWFRALAAAVKEALDADQAGVDTGGA